MLQSKLRCQQKNNKLKTVGGMLTSFDVAWYFLRWYTMSKVCSPSNTLIVTP